MRATELAAFLKRENLTRIEVYLDEETIQKALEVDFFLRTGPDSLVLTADAEACFLE